MKINKNEKWKQNENKHKMNKREKWKNKTKITKNK